MMRESAVVPTFPVAIPIVERVLAKAPLAKVTFDRTNWGWLNRLKNSAAGLEVEAFVGGNGIEVLDQAQVDIPEVRTSPCAFADVS